MKNISVNYIKKVVLLAGLFSRTVNGNRLSSYSTNGNGEIKIYLHNEEVIDYYGRIVYYVEPVKSE